MSRDDSTAILNLLYRYAEFIDLGRLEDAAALFADAQVKVRGGELMDSGALLERWRSVMVIYDDGTPRTKHVITNPIVEIDPDTATATCRSYYTVLQEASGVIKVVVAGRYHDRFRRVDGAWRFDFRDYSLADHWGDAATHIQGFSRS